MSAPETLARISKALTRLAFEQPFFGSLLAMTPLIEEEGIRALATNGSRIYYNPAYVRGLTADAAVFALAHEILHIAYLHCGEGRKAGRDPLRWNAACDYAVNGDLAAAGFRVPAEALLDKRFHGLAVEEIYPLLPAQGLCACLQLMPMAEDARDELLGRVMIAVQAGRPPDAIARRLRLLRASRVPWERQLQNFLRETLCRDREAFLPPSRRHLWDGRYLPSLRAGERARLAVAVDTSGSISRTQLEAFAGELSGIADLCEDLTVLTCDDTVRQRVRLCELPAFLKALEFKGGGGTDFRPAFEALASGPKPDAMLYFTDGDGTFPGGPAPLPTLWCLTRAREVPWGRSIVVTSRGKEE